MVRRISLLTLMLALAVSLAPARSLRAAEATFTVDSTRDESDAIPGDGLCASASGACTLRAAIMETNTLPGVDTIILPPGTYDLSIPGEGELAAATGDLNISDSVTLTGAGTGQTLIDGHGLDRLFETSGTASAITISKIQFRNNGYNPTRVASAPGALLANHGARVTLSDATVIGMNATGALIESDGGDLTIHYVTIWKNSIQANATDGAVVALHGGALHADMSSYDGNSSARGVFDIQEGSAELWELTINGNRADGGAGGITNHGTLTMGRVTLSRNEALGPGDNGSGGALANFGLASLTNVTISDNRAAL